MLLRSHLAAFRRCQFRPELRVVVSESRAAGAVRWGLWVRPALRSRPARGAGCVSAPLPAAALRYE